MHLRRVLAALWAGLGRGARAAYRGVRPRLARLRQEPHVRPARGPAGSEGAQPARGFRGLRGGGARRGGAQRQIRRRLFPLLPPKDAPGAGRRLGGLRAQTRGPALAGAAAARGRGRAEHPGGRRGAPARHEIHPHARRRHPAPARLGAGAHRRDAPPDERPGVRQKPRRRLRPRAHPPAHGRGAALGGEDALLARHGRLRRHGPLRRELRRGLDGPHGPRRLRRKGHPRRGRPAARLLRPAGEPHPLPRRHRGRHPPRRLHERHGAHRRLPLQPRRIFPPPAPLGARRLAEHRLHLQAGPEFRLCGQVEALRQPAPQPLCALLPCGAHLGPRRARGGLALRGAARAALAVHGRAARAGDRAAPPRPGAPALRDAPRPDGPAPADTPAPRAAALGGLRVPQRHLARALAHGHIKTQPPRLADRRAERGPGPQMARALARRGHGSGAAHILARARGAGLRARLAHRGADRAAPGQAQEKRAAPAGGRQALPAGRGVEDLGLFRGLLRA